MWAHAMLPYGVLATAGVAVSLKLLSGKPLDRLESFGMVGLLLLALVRQMVTMAENTRLLAEIRERERLLHHQAFHDPLTGLANRALFMRRLRRALECDADRDEDTGPAISLLFMDLDKFKQVNDTFGHVAGDELLKISAERLRAETRAADTVARLGGDEFGVILDGDASDHPCRTAERLAAAVHAPCLLAGRPYTPRASVGLVTADAVRTARPASPDILFHQADLAMYAAKRERTGRPVIYRPGLPEIGGQPRSDHP
jgi:diguanylate cyclase (GGDEF)-like protein